MKCLCYCPADWLLPHVWSLLCYSFSWGRSYLQERPFYGGLFCAFVVRVCEPYWSAG